MSRLGIQNFTDKSVCAFAVIGLLIVTGCWSSENVKPELESVSVGVDFAWVQLGEKNSASARAIIAAPGATCPSISIDGAAAVSMNNRAIPSSYTGFGGEITVCEYPLTRSVKQVSIGSTPNSIDIPVGAGASDSILVLGDTGCRLKGGSQQWCAGGSLKRGGWGFPMLSVSAADEQTDLILHVGDYLYRESTGTGENSETCDPYNPARGWVNCGDNWLTWKDDFFTPANTRSAKGNALLSHAPWIFVRGNHEDCSRSWQGYFLFFYSQAAPSTCSPDHDVIDPYAVALNDMDIYVVDTSNENSSSAQASFIKVYQDLKGPSKVSWLATHVPTSDLKPAYRKSKLSQRTQLKWIHVGHVHYFRHSSATSLQQAETITGGSGTELSSCSGFPVCSLSSGDCCYGKVSRADQGQYSYLMVDVNSQKTLWDATLKGVDGNTLHTFTVQRK